MKTSIKSSITSAAIIAWLLASVLMFGNVSRVSYVYNSKLPSASTFTNYYSLIDPQKFFLDTIGSLFGLILFFAACLSIGLRMLPRWDKLDVSGLTMGATGFLVGEIFYSVLFLTVIRLGKLTPAFVAGALIAGFFSGLILLVPFFNYCTATLKSTKIDKWEIVKVALVVSIIISSMFLSMNRLGYDATAEYFSHSKIMAVSGLPVYFYPNNAVVVSAFHPGILHAAIIQVFGDQSARMLSWLNGLVILAFGMAIGEKAGLSSKAKIYFLILMMTSTAFVDLLGDGKIEIISTAPILAAVFWMLQNLEKKYRSVYFVIGIFTGFAIISRPYNIFLVSVFVALFYFWNILHEMRTGIMDVKTVLPVIWILPLLLLMGGFHLWQNYAWLGSPLAPLEYAREVDSSIWAWQFNPKLLNVLRLFYPITVSFFSPPQSLGNISPLFVGFLPFLLVPSIRRNYNLNSFLVQIILPAIMVIIVWVIFFFTVVEIRYVWFLWVIFFIAASKLMDLTTSLFKGPIPTLTNLLVVGLLVYMVFRTVVMSVISYAPIDSLGQANCGNFYRCRSLETVNQMASPGERVFVLTAYRYYLRPDLFVCSSRVEEYSRLMPNVKQDSPDFWIELYKLGFRYVIYEEHLSVIRYQFGEIPSLDSVPDWLSVEVISDFDFGGSTEKILHLTALEPEVIQEVECTMTGDGTWQVVQTSEFSDQ